MLQENILNVFIYLFSRMNPADSSWKVSSNCSQQKKHSKDLVISAIWSVIYVISVISTQLRAVIDNSFLGGFNYLDICPL